MKTQVEENDILEWKKEIWLQRKANFVFILGILLALALGAGISVLIGVVLPDSAFDLESSSWGMRSPLMARVLAIIGGVITLYIAWLSLQLRDKILGKYRRRVVLNPFSLDNWRKRSRKQTGVQIFLFFLYIILPLAIIALNALF